MQHYHHSNMMQALHSLYTPAQLFVTVTALSV